MVLLEEFEHTRAESATQHTGGAGILKPLLNCKKATERMTAHDSLASQAQLVISKQGSVLQQAQRVGMKEREKNRAAIISLLHCTHFPTQHHIAHPSNFTQLVDLVVTCGARELQVFF